MSKKSLPPPPPPSCLIRSYKSRDVKGGTVIAKDVLDRKTHEQKLADPDDYRQYIRPEMHCGCPKIHAHCFRERSPRAALDERGQGAITIRLFICPNEDCCAVFTVLPAILARHLWRLWKTVEGVVAGKFLAPRTTFCRWISRLGSDASQLLQAFLALGRGVLGEKVFSALCGFKVKTRQEFFNTLKAHGSLLPEHPLASLSAWIHRLEPGIRFM